MAKHCHWSAQKQKQNLGVRRHIAPSLLSFCLYCYLNSRVILKESERDTESLIEREREGKRGRETSCGSDSGSEREGERERENERKRE